MHNPLAQRVLELPPSLTLDTLDRVAELKRRGVKITSFSNRPGTPTEVIQAAQQAVSEPWASFYTDTRGIPDLRQAVCEKSARKNGIQADPETEILVTTGAKQAMFLAVMALVDPGDEVLLPDPTWVSYEPCVHLAGGKIVRFPLVEREGFQPDVDDMRRRVTAKTKMIILNTPANPTGTVLTGPVLDGIAALAQEHDLVVLSDEVYEYYVYDGRKHISIGSLPGMKERTVTVSSTSKSFNMFGWRVGWGIANAAIIERMTNIHQHSAACATSFAQPGVAVALRLPDTVMEPRVRLFEEARDVLIDGLNSMPGVTCHKPGGAYMAFPNVESFGKTSAEVSRALLEEAGIQTVAGSAFGPNGEGHIRLVFACPAQDAAEGVERLGTALARIRN
jgi:aspartate/methionine/tyrosine aminotransferase